MEREIHKFFCVMILIFHHYMLGDGSSVWKKEHRCYYKVKETGGVSRCNLLFKSANELKEHKDQANHKIRKRKNNRDVTSRPPKQMSIVDAMARGGDQQKTNVSDSTSETDDEEEEVLSAICK